MMWPIVWVWSMLKPKLNCWDLSDLVWSVMKTRQDNKVVDSISAIYAENETKLPWLIGSGMISDENQIEQHRDGSYRSTLRQNQNWIVGTYPTRCGMWWKLDGSTMWPIVRVWFMLISKLNYRDLSNQVQFVMKTKQDNGVANHIGATYIENKIDLLWPIRSGTVYDENKIRQQRD